MDTALNETGFAPAANGRPYGIDGAEEIFQRARIRLTVPQGGFCYDARLGSRLRTLSADTPEPDTAALSLAQEALRPMTNLSVLGAKYEKAPQPAVKVTVEYGGEKREIGVKL